MLEKKFFYLVEFLSILYFPLPTTNFSHRQGIHAWKYFVLLRDRVKCLRSPEGK